jgi:cobalt-zinc-cadmium efflux system outer membrane protein
VKRSLLTTLCGIAATLATLADAGVAGAQQPEAPGASGPFLRLEDLERMALEGNPTVQQAASVIQSVLGRREQARRYPNPIVGYQAEDIRAREPERGKHFLFLQQSIVTGSKRRHVRDAVAQEVVHAEAEEAMQRHRVLNGVRLAFYEALGAARLLEVRRELARNAREAVQVSEELFNIGQADRPDVLAVEIEAERVQLDVLRAEHDLERVWQTLAALLGNPELPRATLVGDLEAEIPALDEDAIRVAVLQQSPELRIARARVEHARASLARARAERVPNLFVRGGLGYNFEHVGPGRDAGVEALFEIGVPLPIFDRNQGNIATAEAQLRVAQQEVRRVELALRARLAEAFASYRNALRTVERYPREVLLRAQQGYELYLNRFRQMAAAYPQVLIARRTLGQVRAEYVRALVDAWQSAVLLQGYLLTDGLMAPEAVPGEPPVTVEAVPFTVTSP